MLKIRYFRLSLPCGLRSFVEKIQEANNEKSFDIGIINTSENDLVLSYAFTRYVTINQIGADGTKMQQSVPSTEIVSMRIFGERSTYFLSVIDPPRSTAIITRLFEAILKDDAFFIETIEFDKNIVDSHVRFFNSALLVSAKIRDFEVYEGAVGRLEISSLSGLRPEIAPFISNKFHRIDSLTYEVTHEFTKGLIHYFRNGSLKVSNQLVETAFPSFESTFLKIE